MESNELNANIAAVGKATTAIEKGMGGAFLQTGTASILKSLVQKSQNLDDTDREQLVAFLSGSSEYAPASGQITGILKTMHDEMDASLAEATAAENAAISALISLVLEATSESNALIAAFSAAVASAKDASISSCIVFKMPVIWPEAGAYSEEPDKNSTNCSRSVSSRFWLFCTKLFKMLAVPVCKKAPPMPFSMAVVALPTAAMFAFSSLDSVAYAPASFARRAVAAATAALAAERSTTRMK